MSNTDKLINPPKPDTSTPAPRRTYTIEQWGAINGYASEHGLTIDTVEGNATHRQRALAQLADAENVLAALATNGAES